MREMILQRSWRLEIYHCSHRSHFQTKQLSVGQCGNLCNQLEHEQNPCWVKYLSAVIYSALHKHWMISVNLSNHTTYQIDRNVVMVVCLK